MEMHQAAIIFELFLELAAENKPKWKLFMKELKESQPIVCPQRSTTIIEMHSNLYSLPLCSQSKRPLINNTVKLMAYGDMGFYKDSVIGIDTIMNAQRLVRMHYTNQLINQQMEGLAFENPMLDHISHNVPGISTLSVIQRINELKGKLIKPQDNIRTFAGQLFVGLFVQTYFDKHPRDLFVIGVCLVALLFFCSDIISDYLKNLTSAELQRILKSRLQFTEHQIHRSIAIVKSQLNQCGHAPKDARRCAIDLFNKSINRNYSKHEDSLDCYTSILAAKLFHHLGDREVCINALHSAICCSTSLYSVIICLHNLTKCMDKEMLLAHRCTKIAYKLCTFHKITTLEHIAAECRLKTKTFAYELMCRYCGKDNVKLTCCTGCMKAIYCSKSCQKNDWRLRHRINCNRFWSTIHGGDSMSLYQSLKHHIFNHF